MNKFYIMVKNFSTKIKNLVKSIIEHSEVLFQRKKTIDDTYITVKQNKITEIRSLSVQLKEIQLKNSQLDKEILVMKDSIDKKVRLIESFQDLITKRSD